MGDDVSGDMNLKAEVRESTLDTLKLAAALTIVTCAVAAFYYFADESLLLRVAGLICAAGIAGFVGLQTDKGRRLAAFGREAQTEVRKVVWPTRQESLQTTMIVMIVVVIVAIVLWAFDLFLSWGVRGLMGLGG
jgi:preprotein translocase subunit SecE